MGAVVLAVVILITVGISGYLIGTLIHAIQSQKNTKLKLWKNFSLSLGFCALFLISWVAQAAAEWQTYTDEQRSHGQATQIGDFTATFAQSTLENWQSEFLQLFSFTIMAAVLIHKGSAESKDSGDLLAAAIKRIEDKLGTDPASNVGGTKDLHVLPDESQGWQLRRADTPEPEGYYDTQAEAIEAGRMLANEMGVTMHIHNPEGEVRDAARNT